MPRSCDKRLEKKLIIVAIANYTELPMGPALIINLRTGETNRVAGATPSLKFQTPNLFLIPGGQTQPLQLRRQ